MVLDEEAAAEALRDRAAAIDRLRNDGVLIACEQHVVHESSQRIDDPLVGRRTPGPEDERGRGLWLANALADLVQVRSGPDGTTVRVHAWLSAAGAAAR